MGRLRTLTFAEQMLYPAAATASFPANRLATMEEPDYATSVRRSCNTSGGVLHSLRPRKKENLSICRFTRCVAVVGRHRIVGSLAE